VTMEGTMCKTVFAGKFIDLFVVVLTLFTGSYFHLHAELLSIAHPQYMSCCAMDGSLYACSGCSEVMKVGSCSKYAD
jgi:hypothetical protein